LNAAVALIEHASRLMTSPMPVARVSTFFGELNLTWRSGDQIVRLSFFSSRPTILQRGDLSQPLGSYTSENDPTPDAVARELEAILPREA
jgi:hypothetical protein